MTFRVVIAKRAKEDLRRYFLLAAEHAPDTAGKWLDRFETALESLAIHPERFALAPENHLVKETIRQSFFGQRVGRFRVLFTIRDEDVIVLHIRRGSMNKATAEDLDLP